MTGDPTLLGPFKDGSRPHFKVGGSLSCGEPLVHNQWSDIEISSGLSMFVNILTALISQGFQLRAAALQFDAAAVSGTNLSDAEWGY